MTVKKFIGKGWKFITNRSDRFSYLTMMGAYGKLSDEEWIKNKFLREYGREIDLENPQTFNEKLQWLKLYDHNPLYTTLVDKYAVREYVSDKIGEEYLIPLIGGPWNTADEIDFTSLPNEFVLKVTHDSGGVIICKDKRKFNTRKAKRILNRALKSNYYYRGREWPYKNVKPRIIAEKYMVDESQKELKDYKIFNFQGKPRVIEVDYDRFVNHKRNLYTTDWKYIDLMLQYPTDPQHKIERPKSLNRMLELAEILSKDMPHVRTDFYVIGEKIYFGEMTFYHGSGFEKFDPLEWNKTFGDWLVLPEKNKYDV